MTNTIASAVPLLLQAVRDAVHALIALRATPSRPIRMAVALSGGRDSMALLDASSALAPELGLTLSALHVHHGLSINADAWARFCGEECAKRSVPLTVHRAAIRRVAGESLEAQARAARYAALAAVDADIVALAHHADDQAETLLLQLLRGAGPEGLAAMPAQRPMRKGPALMRPFLALPRVAIEAYVAARGLAWVGTPAAPVSSSRLVNTTSPPGLDFICVSPPQAPNRAAPATTSAMTFTSSRPT